MAEVASSGAYPWNELTVVLEPGATASSAVLRHEADTDVGSPRLLVQVLRAEGEAEPIALSDDELTASAGWPAPIGG
ncbi:hypothetical protein PPSIR1_01092 [Plesiocystis pacifica SIR-1]|uniref:Uncharacterized protein n=1 Tax=Plesiocystis pacifica SIR-1 TaxID=391625 RepID=A6GFL4_9BACT|nr:hypothetical protein [Plesiocystis pacifica]EDM75328.1 hypothetical protein PPSIR1_01092 [Plesiocystis pacifica SIR-1]